MNEKELKDYFAAAALTGLLANSTNQSSRTVLAEICYGVANAMLEERKYREENNE